MSAVKLLPNYWLVGRVWELKSTRGPNPPVPLAGLRSIVLQQFIRNGTPGLSPNAQKIRSLIYTFYCNSALKLMKVLMIL